MERASEIDGRLRSPERRSCAGASAQGGESVALARLKYYLWDTDLIANYFQTRNGMLGGDYSTKFAPWLAHGCISPRTIHEVRRRLLFFLTASSAGSLAACSPLGALRNGQISEAEPAAPGVPPRAGLSGATSHPGVVVGRIQRPLSDGAGAGGQAARPVMPGSADRLPIRPPAV